jgi:RimJ/RimL family protein N-acetyltransferase
MEPIRREDSEDLFEAVVSQDSVMRWLATGRADSRSAAEAMCDDHVAHWARHGYGDFAVRDAATHAFLGRVGLRNRAWYGTDLGFALHPRAQGRGIAGEAGRACLDLAFRRLALPVVFAFVLPGNTASIAALRRLGAQEAGTVQSSGLHCLRYRFDPTAGPAAAGHAVADGDDGDDGDADLRLRYAPGPGDREDNAALRDGLPDPFGVDGLGLVRAEKEHTLTAVCDGRLVASLGWLLREMAFDGAPRRVAGLGSVLVHPAHRDRGIAKTMISVAVEHARAAGAETVMLLCRPELVPLYTQSGWRRMSAPVTFRQPVGTRLCPLATVTYDLAELPRPIVGVDLQGLPF